ncbi:MAG: hypothetical protein HY791_34650 [Deltaproteobacteria bacterium]|nr:hypothetical protein [Deltaproteobacteria bacterium]
MMRPAIWCGELSTDPQTHRVRASNTRSDFVPKLPGSMPLSCVVLRDQGGDLSAFLEYFIGNLAREINVLRGRSGTVFPRSPPKRSSMMKRSRAASAARS